MVKWLVNIALAGLVVFFSANIYRVWTHRPAEGVRRESDAEPAGARPGPGTRRAAPRQPPLSHYKVISAQNLFTEERSDVSPTQPSTDAKAIGESRYARSIALYGTLIRDDTRSALVGTARSRRDAQGTRWVKVGDAIDQVTVVGIEDDRIFIQEGGSTFEVKLDDRSHPLKRVRPQRPQKSRIVSTREPEPRPAAPIAPAAVEPAPTPVPVEPEAEGGQDPDEEEDEEDDPDGGWSPLCRRAEPLDGSRPSRVFTRGPGPPPWRPPAERPCNEC